MNTYWLININDNNYNVLKGRSFDILGFPNSYNKLTNKIAKKDNLVFYISTSKVFSGYAEVTSDKFYDDEKIWQEKEISPYRVKIKTKKILTEGNYVEASDVVPSLNYVKKWPPEKWELALMNRVHVISQNDFMIIKASIDSAEKKIKRNNKKTKGKKL